jgi:hypothetical protein
MSLVQLAGHTAAYGIRGTAKKDNANTDTMITPLVTDHARN